MGVIGSVYSHCNNLRGLRKEITSRETLPQPDSSLPGEAKGPLLSYPQIDGVLKPHGKADGSIRDLLVLDSHTSVPGTKTLLF